MERDLVIAEAASPIIKPVDFDVSTTPSRMPSSRDGKINNDVLIKLEANKENPPHSQGGGTVADVTPKPPSRRRTMEDVPEEVKNLFKRIPSPAEEESLGQSLAHQDPQTSSLGGSLGVVDDIPTLPSRFVSDSSLDDEHIVSESVRDVESFPPPVPEEAQLSPEKSLGRPLALQDQVTPSLAAVDDMPSLPSRFVSISSLGDEDNLSESARDVASFPTPVPEEAELSPRKSLGQPLVTLQDQVTPSLAAVDDIPTLPSRFLSISSFDDEHIVSESARDVESFPTPVPEEAELSPGKSLVQSLTLQDQATPSLAAVDDTPTLPSRFLSRSFDDEDMFPAQVALSPTKEKREIHGHTSRNEGDVLTEALRIVESPLDEPTETSHTPTTVEPEVDIRALVVSRIPKHIMEQLSLQEWYRILEPTVFKGNRPDFDAVPDNVVYEEEAMVHHEDEEKTEGVEIISGVLYCPEEGEEESILQERKTEEHPGEIDFIAYQNKLRWCAAMGDAASIAELSELSAKEYNDETSEKGGNTHDTIRNSWIGSHIVANDVIYSYDHESKEQESEDLQGLAVPQCRESRVRKEKKSISFGTAHIRRHERVLEVHPCTSSGPSVGIGWNYIESEEPIVFRRHERRKCLVLSREDREDIVNDLGYSPRHIAKAIRKVLKIKGQRRRTAHNLQKHGLDVQRVEYMAEKCNRKIKKLHKKFRKKQ